MTLSNVGISEGSLLVQPSINLHNGNIYNHLHYMSKVVASNFSAHGNHRISTIISIRLNNIGRYDLSSR